MACTDSHGQMVRDNVNNVYIDVHAVYVHIAVYIYTVPCIFRMLRVFNDDVYNEMVL